MEKKVFTFCMALFLCLMLEAQDKSYGSIEWDIIGFSMVLPSGGGVSAGIGLHSEPRYNLNDKISIGLRWDAAIFGSGDEESADIGISSSLALMGDYYLSNNENKRAFVGLGIGSFDGAGITISNPDGTETEAEGGSSLGLIPRVGYELGLVRLMLEYNFAFKEEVPNYLGLKLALNIGGRYKG